MKRTLLSIAFLLLAWTKVPCQELHWTATPSQYANNMTILAVIDINGEEQRNLNLEVGAFCGTETRGSGKALFCPPVNRHIVPLLVYGNDQDLIQFKLYDHSHAIELNPQPGYSVTFQEDGYGTVTNPLTLHFVTASPTSPILYTQQVNLKRGWNWWSTPIEQQGYHGLELLMDSLGSSGYLIKNANQFVNYNSGNWTGSLDSINNEEMYMISVNEPISFHWVGSPAKVTDHAIPINTGWNWIGFTATDTMPIEEAFQDFEVTEGDLIKSDNQFSMFTAADGWRGHLTSLQPGIGYMYKHTGNADTLVFPETADKSRFHETYEKGKIKLRTSDRTVCRKSDLTSLKATFSFSHIESQEKSTRRGVFSAITMANTVTGGNLGEPQVPVVNELIAVPFGAKPIIRITSFSTTDYRLEDYGIQKLAPRQPSVKKSQKPEEQPFHYNEAAYRKSGLGKEPKAMVSVEGVMRGVQLGKMTIEPVSYDPVNNLLRVFNNIEVEVLFEGADAKATEEMLINTYSPYFDVVYKQLFNGRAVLDTYADHPDLYTIPVKMLVVTTSKYANSSAFNSWITWKKRKGIDVEVQLVTSTTPASSIRSLIQGRYQVNHPTFLVIVGDRADVRNFTTYTAGHSTYVSDLQYASIDNDVFHDMYMSRMSVSTTTELNNLVNKILAYEKCTLPDLSYLDDAVLVAGWDRYWTEAVGKPTIQYANTYYYNAEHGFGDVHTYLATEAGQYQDCYTWLSSGVGFLNYTAHASVNSFNDPYFDNTEVASLSNKNKYFWVLANCCLTANWGTACLGETMLRAANKGAFGYIGSIPESYWYEDYYFAVGATTVTHQMPSYGQTTLGAYDGMFMDDTWNTLNAVPFLGNLAVTYAHANGYEWNVADLYYWRAYTCLGDGSVMPYRVAPTSNVVSHNDILPIGATDFEVNALPGSYVSITVNDEIIGVAQVGSTGKVSIPIIPQTQSGFAMIVVTCPQRQPYIMSINIKQGVAVQSQALSLGWNWFSCYLELNGPAGLETLEQALSGEGTSIVSQGDGVATLNGDHWSGALAAIQNEQMYQIYNQGNGSLYLSGFLSDPESHPITLHPGWNWIGYPVSESLPLGTALASYQPQANDIIKSHDSFSTYIAGYGWWGHLNTLSAGVGYMYRSLANTQSTLQYQTGAGVNRQ